MVICGSGQYYDWVEHILLGQFSSKSGKKITWTWQWCPELNSHTLLQGSLIIPGLVKTQILPNMGQQILHFCISYINTNCFSWYFRLKTWYLILFITSDPSLVPVLGLECNKSMFRAMSCPWFYSNFSNESVPDCHGFLNSMVPWVCKNRTIWEVLVHSSGSTCSILLWWRDCCSKLMIWITSFVNCYLWNIDIRHS